MSVTRDPPQGSPVGSKTPTGAGGRRHSRSTPYSASRKRHPRGVQPSSASAATITPWRVTQSNYASRRRSHSSATTAVPSTPRVAHSAVEDQEEAGSIPEPEGAETGYFAVDHLLDSLLVGSEVAGMGKEAPSSLEETIAKGTGAAGPSPIVPRSLPLPVAVLSTSLGYGEESSVLLTDDWLYQPVGEEAGW